MKGKLVRLATSKKCSGCNKKLPYATVVWARITDGKGKIVSYHCSDACIPKTETALLGQ